MGKKSIFTAIFGWRVEGMDRKECMARFRRASPFDMENDKAKNHAMELQKTLQNRIKVSRSFTILCLSCFSGSKPVGCGLDMPHWEYSSSGFG